MKLLFESWRKYLQELRIEGDGDGFLVYRDKLIRFDSNDSPEEVAKKISDVLGVDDDFRDISDLRDAGEEIPDVVVGEMNGTTMTIYSSGGLQRDPKSSIMIKKALKALGGSRVEWYSASSEDEFSLPSSAVRGKMPRTVYHGTSTKYLYPITKIGLKPGESQTNYEGIVHDSAIFFTTRMSEAQMHAEHTTRKVGGDPLILAMEVPDPALIIPDYDADMAAGDSGCYDYICYSLRKRQKTQKNLDPMSLSREFGLYGYRGRIAPSFIKSYFILTNSDEREAYGTSINDYDEVGKEEALTYARTKEEYGYGTFEEPEWEDEEE